MLSGDESVAVAIEQVEFVAAYLGTFAAVGAATHRGESRLTVAAVAHAKRPVDKRFKFHFRHLAMNLRHLLKCHLARQYKLREAGIGKEAGFGCIADVGLGACMESDRGQFEAKQCQVLNNECIDADAVEFVNQLTDGVEFRVVDDGVDCHIDAGTEAVGILDNTRNVGNGITRRRTRSVA